MKLYQVVSIGAVAVSIVTGSALAGMPANYHVKPLSASERHYNGIDYSNFHAKGARPTVEWRMRHPNWNGRSDVSYGYGAPATAGSDWWTRCQEAIKSGQPVPFDSEVNAFCAIGPNR